MTTKTKPEDLLEEERKKDTEIEPLKDEQLARDVAYHQAIVARGTTREASRLLFREPLAGR